MTMGQSNEERHIPHRMKNAPKISVIVPAYNAAETIAQTIMSVSLQTCRDFEIIVVNDGSLDDTSEVAANFASSVPSLKIINQENSGVAAARNAGIEAADGEYVALLDADDLWVPEKLQVQIGFLESNPDVGAVQSGAYFVDQQLNLLSARPCWDSRTPLLDTLKFLNLPNTMSTLLIRKDVFKRVGLFNPDLEILEEWDMVIRLARFANLRSIPTPLSLYRVHPGNRSRDLNIHIQPGLQVLTKVFCDQEYSDIWSSKHVVYSRLFVMFSGGSLRASQYWQAVYWAVRSLIHSPYAVLHAAMLPMRRFYRRFSYNHDDVNRARGLVKAIRNPHAAGV